MKTILKIFLFILLLFAILFLGYNNGLKGTFYQSKGKKIIVFLPSILSINKKVKYIDENGKEYELQYKIEDDKLIVIGNNQKTTVFSIKGHEFLRVLLKGKQHICFYNDEYGSFCDAYDNNMIKPFQSIIYDIIPIGVPLLIFFLIPIIISRKKTPFILSGNLLAIRNKKYNIHKFTGKIIKQEKYTTTHGSGGGSYGSGYTASVSIFTTVHTNIILADEQGKEVSFRLGDIVCREGNELTIAWAIEEGKETGNIIAVKNNSTNDLNFYGLTGMFMPRYIWVFLLLTFGTLLIDILYILLIPSWDDEALWVMFLAGALIILIIFSFITLALWTAGRLNIATKRANQFQSVFKI
jgi:hypothetical protein